MRCLYEVLEIRQDSDSETIKKAYRQQALRWHPDKNASAEAEERFKEITNAFEVLSDAHERAWYDAHRGAILRSDTSHQAGDNSTSPSNGDLPPLYEFFNPSCFSGYHSEPSGFYSVYGGVFQRIDERELRDGGGGDKCSIPFGDEQSSDGEIQQFYKCWTSFVSVVDFAFVDEYNPSSAPNRRTRRAMEEHNSKRRRSAKREYVEMVRQLAKFVKKRDVRALRMQKEEGERKAKKKAEEEERRMKMEQERREKAAAYQEAEWIIDGEKQDAMSEEMSEESVRNELWCVVCDKIFKSERAMENHEKSKKHREKLAKLKKELEEEEEVEETSQSFPLHDKDDELSDGINQKSIDHEEVDLGESSNPQDEEDHVQFSTLMGNKEKTNDEQFYEEKIALDKESVPPSTKKQTKGKKSRRTKNRKKDGDDHIRAETTNEEMASLVCSTCNAQFESRNQLFKHLKQTNHASVKN